MSYLFLAFIAALGFIASVVCHILGWLHIEPPGGKSVFVLRIGFIVLWIPLVIFANRTMPKGAKGNLEHLLAELPAWVRLVGKMLVFYAVANFVYFIYSTSSYPKGSVPFYIELRGFSGHWMVFYGMATAGFFALARLARKKKENETVT